MRVGTPAVATHLLADPKAHLTPIGSFLRKSSLDELPRLWSILVGEMSFVGPPPALFNQRVGAKAGGDAVPKILRMGGAGNSLCRKVLLKQ